MADEFPAERHVYGRLDAPVTILEFGDLECPYCRAAAGPLKELVDSSDGRVRLVWRHFPLFEVHPYALSAALAAEVAGRHGKFWEMHDALLAEQSRLTEPDLRRAAEAMGIDPAEVVGDRAQALAPAVQGDYTAGIELGVRGTPAIYVDGTYFHGKVTLARLREAVDAA
ncbi:thioredoxin domain-containing protein [Cellulomonas sp. URHD0024]|uniref:DsbA family protein n=1 Tax=Cellulomonas sp. URHD0024 TaxID=1302620 RepID=UPI00048142E1|nr:thioredoxin domain-containing protein [Cellulomonas sp. URHD0024]